MWIVCVHEMCEHLKLNFSNLKDKMNVYVQSVYGLDCRTNDMDRWRCEWFIRHAQHFFYGFAMLSIRFVLLWVSSFSPFNNVSNDRSSLHTQTVLLFSLLFLSTFFWFPYGSVCFLLVERPFSTKHYHSRVTGTHWTLEEFLSSMNHNDRTKKRHGQNNTVDKAIFLQQFFF